MIKVYQTIVDRGHGNCMQAAIASLFELELNDVPNFIEYKDGWFRPLYEFTAERGYKYEGTKMNKNWSIMCNPTYECFHKVKFHKPQMLTKRLLYSEEGVDGLFYASVLSPKYFNYNSGFTAQHAVIIDRDFNIVHDPNPEYQKILNYPLASLLKYNGIIDVYLINPVSK